MRCSYERSMDRAHSARQFVSRRYSEEAIAQRFWALYGKSAAIRMRAKAMPLPIAE